MFAALTADLLVKGVVLGSTDETPLGGPSVMLVQDQPRC